MRVLHRKCPTNVSCGQRAFATSVPSLGPLMQWPASVLTTLSISLCNGARSTLYMQCVSICTWSLYNVLSRTCQYFVQNTSSAFALWYPPTGIVSTTDTDVKSPEIRSLPLYTRKQVMYSRQKGHTWNFCSPTRAFLRYARTNDWCLIHCIDAAYLYTYTQ